MTMTGWPLAAILALMAGLGAWLLLRPLVAWLAARAVIDLPNERSSHSHPTPRGGGIAVVAAILLAGAVWVSRLDAGAFGVLLAAMAALALLSWFDDRLRGLPIALRLGAQAAAVALGLALLPLDASLFGGAVPLWLDRLVCFLAWLWFTNLFNFMDGINGITGTQTAAIGFGLAALALLDAVALPLGGLALIAAAAGLGFLPWNWGRAKVFLGDVGSVPLGYLLGGLLLHAALQGQWAAALILPLYYWLDATITLLRRLLRGEKIWQAHRQHFYQQASRKFGNHAAVVRRLAALNAALVGLALLSPVLPGGPWLGLGFGLALTLAVCRRFADPAERLE